MRKTLFFIVALVISLNSNSQVESLNKNTRFLYENYEDQFGEIFTIIPKEKLKNNKKAQKKEKVYEKLFFEELNAQGDALFRVKDSFEIFLEEMDTTRLSLLMTLIMENGYSEDWYFDKYDLSDEEYDERIEFENKLSDSELSSRKIEDNLGGLLYLYKWSKYNPKRKEKYIEPLMNISCDWVQLLEIYGSKNANH